jgi:hypothetical protein
MKQKKSVLIAIILCGTIGLAAQLGSAQQSGPAQQPGSAQQPGLSQQPAQEPGLTQPPGSPEKVPGRQLPEQRIPERVQPPTSGTQQPGQSGMSADEINKVKEALKAQGHNPGPMNGKLDAETQQALRQFQQANNLPVTGSIDAATAVKLGVSVRSQPRSTPGGSPDSSLKGSGELSPTPKPGPDSSLPGGPGDKDAIK